MRQAKNSNKAIKKTAARAAVSPLKAPPPRGWRQSQGFFARALSSSVRPPGSPVSSQTKALPLPSSARRTARLSKAFLARSALASLSSDENLNETLELTFSNIENSAKGAESEADFEGLFADFDVNSNKLLPSEMSALSSS
jgi:hypothetical protein